MPNVPATGPIIVSLGFKEAVDVIYGTKTVMYKHGVWNPYKPTETDKVISAIMHSGYGADVRKNSNGEFFVSIPCDSDMW